MGKEKGDSAYVNIVIGGEAGQGLVTVGQILGRCLVRSGHSIITTQDYQSRIRGGHNTFVIRVGADDVKAPQEAIDLLVALNAETVKLYRKELSSEGVIVGDAAYDISDEAYLSMPFDELTSERYMNVAALGIVAEILGLDRRVVTETLHDTIFQDEGSLLKERSHFRWLMASLTLRAMYILEAMR